MVQDRWDSWSVYTILLPCPASITVHWCLSKWLHSLFSWTLHFVIKYYSFQGYKYDSYQGRMELAYLDYNHHKDRKVMVSQHGTTVLNRLYNRRSRTHFVVEVKESKKYEYIPGTVNRLSNSAWTVKRNFVSKFEEIIEFWYITLHGGQQVACILPGCTKDLL